MIFRCWLGCWCFAIDVSILNVGLDVVVDVGRDLGINVSLRCWHIICWFR